METPVVAHYPAELQTTNPIWYGTAEFGTKIRGKLAADLIEQYYAAGGRMLDTAHCYAYWASDGEAGCSEKALGAALRRVGEPEGILIATKGGHPDGGKKYPRPDKYLTAATIERDISDSLERLERETIDLYYLHRDDPRVPADEIISILNAHIQAGTIKHLGASNWSAERINAANTYAVKNNLVPFVISQVQWSLSVPNWKPVTLGPQNTFVNAEEKEAYAAMEMPVAAYSPTGGGWLTNFDKVNGSFETPENLARRERLHELAKQLNATPAQVAIAYLLYQPIRTYPIFATSLPEHMTEILDSRTITLTANDLLWLEAGE